MASSDQEPPKGLTVESGDADAAPTPGGGRGVRPQHLRPGGRLGGPGSTPPSPPLAKGRHATDQISPRTLTLAERQIARVDLAQKGLPARLPSTACAPGPAREPRQAGVLQQLPPAPRRAVTSATFLSLAVSESLLLPWDAVRGPRSKVHGHGPEHVVFKSSSQEGHAARSEF